MVLTRSQATKESKPKGRGKRKVVSDSDDDPPAPSKKTSTPKKPLAKKQTKRESPVGEITTSSDYFAASGKSKPARSTPAKSKVTPQKVASNGATTPQARNLHETAPRSSNRSAAKKRSRPNYNEDREDEDSGSDFNPKEVTLGGDSGEDIHEAEYKGKGASLKDDYESEYGEEDIVIPTRTRKKDNGGSSRKQGDADGHEEDIAMKDVRSEDEHNVDQEAPKTLPGRKGRKRKSVELDEDENDDDIAPAKKKEKGAKPKASTAKSPKKGRGKASKDDEPEHTEAQNILDSIPTIRPPTPPPRDASKKFVFGGGHASQAAPAAGSKELPEGAENCLAGLSFVFTGLLDSLSRDDGAALIKSYGGKVVGAPSSRTSYVILGNDAGPKKLETIAKYKIKTINEDGLFELVRKMPANGGDGKAAEKAHAKKEGEQKKAEENAAKIEEEEQRAAKANQKLQAKNSAGSQPSSQPRAQDAQSRLWTVKHAPTATSMICGNKGQVEKLQTWLRAFPGNLRTKFKKPGKDGHGSFRAVIIHGPPGIGKTTAAHLAARLEGYDVVESNASDTRSKKLVETGLKGILDTTSLLGYFAGDGKKVESERKKLVLIMDEVDGMSAGDRGGVGALAAVCKKTHIPIILICNERNQPKMRPFSTVAYDMLFRRPTADQIRSRLMTICYREGLKVSPNVLDALIEGSRADIRQVINMLSTAKLDQQAMGFDQGKEMSKAWEKHVILKPWDLVSKILGGGLFAASSTSNLNDKIELYFNDHEMSSLMLQENYLGTTPVLGNSYTGKERKLKMLELTDKAAESISDGDLVDRMIHGSQQQWSLMPTHAVFSFVRPASFVYGSQAGSQTRFTSWLGQNSKQGKLMRQMKEIQGHMRLRSTSDRHAIRQQYLPLLWYKLVEELKIYGKDALDGVISLMDSYFLTKEDWDAILELGVGPMDMESIKIDTQTKSAFTRTYNSQSHPLPFIKASDFKAAKKVAKEKPDLEEAIDESDDGDDVLVDSDAQGGSDADELDLKKDKYVKAPTKRKPAAKKGATKKASANGKGRGKAKDESEGEMDVDDDESEEKVGSRKGKGPSKGKTARSKR